MSHKVTIKVSPDIVEADAGGKTKGRWEDGERLGRLG